MRQHSFTADFETNVGVSETRVWGWGIASVASGQLVEYGNDIKSFFKYIYNKNIDVYFHNLKFDGMFILNHLLKSGFTHSEGGEPLTFNTLITDNGQFFQIEIIWKRFKKRVVKTVILDSLKKLPFSVDEIAKSFNLPIYKLSIDYLKVRDENHELTPQEIAYIRNDVEIMAQALGIMFADGLKKMTIASDALHSFKSFLRRKDDFRYYFPILDLDVDNDIRRSYKGGFTYLNPKYQDIEVQGLVFDVNSLYPYVMRTKMLPHGVPILFVGEYQFNAIYPLYIQRLSCSFKIKKDKIPTIQLKNTMRFIPTEYLANSKGDIIELVLTSVDLKLFLEHYDVLNLEYHNGYMFKAADNLFKEYIDYWGHIKETTKGAERQKAKLMLNSLYGKFATNPLKRNKIPSYLKDDGTIGFEHGDLEEGKPLYTALSSFVTSYARDITIRAAQDNYHRFIYADTDSLHLEGYELPSNIKIHPTHLGHWDLEMIFEKGKYLRAKSYMHQVKGENKITVAGMPYSLHEKVTFENFERGASFFGKLQQRQVRGGVVLEPTTFTINK